MLYEMSVERDKAFPSLRPWLERQNTQHRKQNTHTIETTRGGIIVLDHTLVDEHTLGA